MYAAFTLRGQTFTVMDGPGKHGFDFNEGISFVINCKTQQEVDDYWEKLTSGGGEESQCGWLKDKFGVSWQIIPRVLMELISDPDPVKSGRAMRSMMTMKKIDIAALQRACKGQ